MDSETLKLLQQAAKEGVSSAAWLILAVSLIGAGVGASLGAYLRQKGLDLALRENFKESLGRLEQQTRVIAEIQHEFAMRLKQTESLQAEAAFTRELYCSGLREYSTAQAGGLRQAYLLIFEPESSTPSGQGKELEERLKMASHEVMRPLRSYIGLLDETTIGHINRVHNIILELGEKPADSLKREKNAIFSLTEEARQHAKADKIAFRLGLLERPLDKGAPSE